MNFATFSISLKFWAKFWVNQLKNRSLIQQRSVFCFTNNYNYIKQNITWEDISLKNKQTTALFFWWIMFLLFLPQLKTTWGFQVNLGCWTGPLRCRQSWRSDSVSRCTAGRRTLGSKSSAPSQEYHPGFWLLTIYIKVSFVLKFANNFFKMLFCISFVDYI